MSEDKKDENLKKRIGDVFDFFIALDIIEQKEKDGELGFILKDFDELTNMDLSSDEKLSIYLEKKLFEKVEKEHENLLKKYKKEIG